MVSGSPLSHLDRGNCESQVWSLLEKWRLGSHGRACSSDLLSRDLLSSLSLSPRYPSSRERMLPRALCWSLGALPMTRLAQAWEFAVRPYYPDPSCLSESTSSISTIRPWNRQSLSPMMGQTAWSALCRRLSIHLVNPVLQPCPRFTSTRAQRTLTRSPWPALTQPVRPCPSALTGL